MVLLNHLCNESFVVCFPQPHNVYKITSSCTIALATTSATTTTTIVQTQSQYQRLYSRPSHIRPPAYPTPPHGQIHLLRKLRDLMQGKIYKIVKILGRMNSRAVMMERFQDAEFSWHCCPQKTVTIPKSVCVLYLLFTHDSQKRMRAVLTIHPTLAYPFFSLIRPLLIRSFHSSDPCFSVSCPKGVGYARVYCTVDVYIGKQ